MTALQMVGKICEFADDLKAEQIEVIDIREKTSVADFFVVCSGTSDTHANAIADRVEEKMKGLGVRPLRSNSGPTAGGWILYDYGEVVLHVMLVEKREFYDLETLWRTMQTDPNLIT